MKSFLKVLTERTHLSLIPEISDEYTFCIKTHKDTPTNFLVTVGGLTIQHPNLPSN
jgi:F0F1-type ATP synthase delta subunit